MRVAWPGLLLPAWALWTSVTVSFGQGGNFTLDSSARALPVENSNGDAAAEATEIVWYTPSLLAPVALFESDTLTQKVEVGSSHSEPVPFTVATHVSGLFGGWLEVEPTEGTIPANGVAEISVTFSTDGLWQGRYHGSIVLDSPAIPQQVWIDVQLLHFCSEIRATSPHPPAVTFLEDDATVGESPPVWDTASTGNESALWVELPLQFNRPVSSVPASAFRAESDAEMTIFEVTQRDIRGAMCSDFVVRLRAPTDPWRSSSTSLCITLQAGAVASISDPIESFPEAKTCMVVRHKPHGRLLGVFMAQSGDSGLVTSHQTVEVLALFSSPLNEVTLGTDDFFIEGPLEPSITSLRKVHSSGTQWHVALDVGNYYGEVRIALRGAVEDLYGGELAQVPLLVFTRERVTPLESLGYLVHDELANFEL